MGFLALRSSCTKMSSSSSAPTCASTTKASTSASCIASSADALTCTEMPSGLDSQPPVSIIINLRPPHSHSYCTRSRVTPGVSSTIASRRPMKRFINVDFPTFGRPKIATIGRPNKERSFSSSQIQSAVSSKVKSVESIKTASIALARGDTARVESISSRDANDCPTAVDGESVSAERRAARAAISACR